ncbi:TetR/AcrR family transcriptional regulator [Cryptosporangium phraense]|uniref:TetR family transcriptional regulator n=1 Tax=Cryptosporangium phraense TaxID=2593070 RepID=A0A545ANR2_9ACTN|nr:TetR/AcrR family transcriptional regulator [Cryptosporangium phraense]TQS42375.1 TetR family transcriptional regulator [Cryptosporangium phraense]
MSRRDDVVDAAEEILEAEGFEGLTMRRLGAALSMRAPSLYKHIANKTEIEAALQDRALRLLAEALEGSDGDLAALAATYRRWALDHPRLYALATRRPLRCETAAVPLIDALGGDDGLARVVWGAAHGLVDLELAGRFPADADLDDAWARLIAAFSSPSPRG